MNQQTAYKEVSHTNGSKSTVHHPRFVDIKILMFHRVVTNESLALKHPFCLHVSEFRRHIEWLDQHGFVPITLEDYRLYYDGQLDLPRKPIILTFDDGYLDTYEVAFPVLSEFGMKGVVFVLGDRSVKNNTWDWKYNGSPAPLMENHHLLEMSEAGIEIGAHSMTHAKLTMLDERTAWNEISRSRILLEIVLNKPVLSFSYPYGFVNESVKRMVSDAGFTHACSVWSGPLLFGKDNFELRRIPVLNSSTTISLAVKLSAPFQYYSWLRSKFKNMIVTGSGSHSGTPLPKTLEPVAAANINNISEAL
ncbi:MAG: polysaccharide deacetylase family protein [Bacteroidota bacterium]